MKGKLDICYRAVGELSLSPRNARTHSAEQIKQVANSVAQFGFINPIVIDSHNSIVAGHARLMAAKRLGIPTVPCIEVDHLSEDELRAYMLADNKIAENAGWDEDLLRVELEYLTTIDLNFDVDLTGFSIAEVDILLGAADQATSEEVDIDTLTPVSEPITQPGDIWQLGLHRLACGDCRDASLLHQLFGEETAHMVFADPPYNVKIQGHVSGLGQNQHPEFAMASGEMTEDEFSEFLHQACSTLAKFSAEGSLHYICMDWRHLQQLLRVGDSVYDELINLCIWAKTNGGMGSLYRSQHEMIPVFKKGKGAHLNNVKLGKDGRYRTNVWTYPGVNTFSQDRQQALAIHPTVKPTQLVADAILDVTKPGQIVLDGFIGSGTTLLAAEKTSRRCYGVEIDPGYVDVALRRWIDLTDARPVNLTTGEPYQELPGGGESAAVKHG